MDCTLNHLFGRGSAVCFGCGSLGTVQPRISSTVLVVSDGCRAFYGSTKPICGLGLPQSYYTRRPTYNPSTSRRFFVR
ncbi:hypothetical protein BR93DRAFT_26567 [Coniochaeta sp. PMI_546]|nr:hypothetical protein BR93DRAFT_26567 [Coniochaeta sp. PMI_546]